MLTIALDIAGFVFDIDGTLCNYDGLLNLQAVHSIRWLRHLGYPVILASGRGPWDTFYLGVFMGCTPVSVCENGGILMTSPSDLQIFGDKTLSLRAYDLLCKQIEDVKVKPVSARLTEVVLLRTFEVSRGQKLLDEGKIPVTINDSKFALHLTKTGINKGLTLMVALKTLGIDPRKIAVVGDSDTDVPMFEKCGFSAAVGNAPEHVKSKASYACKNDMGDGAVEAVEHIVKDVISH
jgi:phosphoglycolate phosphatase